MNVSAGFYSVFLYSPPEIHSVLFFNFKNALRAVIMTFDINFFHAIRRMHHAIPVIAMNQSVIMPEFVIHFF